MQPIKLICQKACELYWPKVADTSICGSTFNGRLFYSEYFIAKGRCVDSTCVCLCVSIDLLTSRPRSTGVGTNAAHRIIYIPSYSPPTFPTDRRLRLRPYSILILFSDELRIYIDIQTDTYTCAQLCCYFSLLFFPLSSVLLNKM